MEATQDHIPDSSPPDLAEGYRLAQEGGNPELVRWLTEHPELAGELAQFLMMEGDVQSLMAHSRPADPDGTTVGGYVLKNEIGHGGMGVVYRAYDPALKIEVALKRVLGGPMLTAAERARFHFEAEVVASLDHPNIVRVLVMREDGGAPYLVMPLMVGGSLADWLKARGPDRCLASKAAAQIVHDIALGVHHAHQHGLIHRDLKPGNILLDREGRPHVADFGLARRLDATMTDGLAGTVAYMAPEQASPGRRVLTTAVDVHALGAILFELLDGEPPYGRGEVGSVLRKVIDDPVPTVRRDGREIPRDLEGICRKCLQKEPGDRYATAADLADDLTRFLNDEAPRGQPRPGVMTAVFRAIRRRRETPAMPSWRAAFWGAANSAVALAAIQLAVSLDAPAWVARAAFGCYLVGWATAIWVFLVLRLDRLNPVERSSSAIQFGMIFASASVAVGQFWLHDGSVPMAFQPIAAVVGLGLFAHGATYWGRVYLAASLVILGAAFMPLIPVPYWPGTYGVMLVLFQVWVGFDLRRNDRDARAEAASEPVGTDPAPPQRSVLTRSDP